MVNNYWSSQDNKLINEFYYCYTGITSGKTRNRIFKQLQPKLNLLIGNAIQIRISSWSDEDKEEARQDCLLRIWNALSNKLDERKIQGVLKYLWVITNNMLLTIGRRHSLITVPDIIYDSEHLSIVTFPEVEEYNEDDIQEYRKAIIKELDRKIIEQEKLNRVNTIYLTLLREYLIANDYDGKGFQDYICQTLNINRKNFYQINFKLNIRSSVFNNKQK